MRQFYFITLCVLFLFIGCSDDSSDEKLRISADFESGSIGYTEEKGWQDWDIYLKDDNDDSSLRDSYRNWWYIRLDNIVPGRRLTLTLKNRGWSYYYLPVFSYDRHTWYRFDESEVALGEHCGEDLSGCTLEISTDRFDRSRVFIARFYPYTTGDLNTYLSSIEDNSHVTVTSLGLSTGYSEAIPLIRIEDPDVNDVEKRAIWMHARSHPGETAASFLLEGIIRQFLSDLDSGLDAAESLVFYIAPMHNVDGVIEGNYRTDLSSRNLENEWRPDDSQTLFIREDSPLENRLLNEEMAKLVTNTSYLAEMIALNLHSSNSPVDTPAFAYPHFGDDPDTYSPEEISLWQNALWLIELITDYYGGRFSPPPEEGGSGFLNYAFPETWWWRNMSDECLAMTIETVYSKAGFDHWITPDDIRELGESVTLAIYDYFESDTKTLHEKRTFNKPAKIRYELPGEIESKM